VRGDGNTWVMLLKRTLNLKKKLDVLQTNKLFYRSRQVKKWGGKDDNGGRLSGECHQRGALLILQKKRDFEGVVKIFG